MQYYSVLRMSAYHTSMSVDIQDLEGNILGGLLIRM